MDISAVASTPGRIVIQAVGTGGQLVGEGGLVDVRLCMRAEAPPEACENISVLDASFTNEAGQPIPVTLGAASALCVSNTCARGDLTNDNAVTLEDAQRALDISVKLVEPTDCDWQAGELNGDGVIDCGDATLILRMIEELDTSPGESDTTLVGILSEHEPIQVGLEYEIKAKAGELVRVPITISNAAGMAGFTIVASFPPPANGLVLQNASSGALTDRFLKRISQGDRYIRASMASSELVSFTKEGGELLSLEFLVSPSAETGTVFPITMNAVRLAGQFADNFDWYTDVIGLSGQIVVEAEPAPEAPTNLTASKGIYTDRVEVTWNPVAEGVEYMVYRATTDSFAQAQPVSGWLTWTRYTDWNTVAGELVPGGCFGHDSYLYTTYYYWVVARNAAGIESARSAAVEGWRGYEPVEKASGASNGPPFSRTASADSLSNWAILVAACIALGVFRRPATPRDM